MAHMKTMKAKPHKAAKPHKGKAHSVKVTRAHNGGFISEVEHQSDPMGPYRPPLQGAHETYAAAQDHMATAFGENDAEDAGESAADEKAEGE